MSDMTIPLPEGAVSVPESVPASPLETAAEPVEKAESQAEAPASEAATPEPEKDEKKRGASGRIAQLYAEKRQAEAEASAARYEVARVKQELEKIQKLRSDPNTPYEQQEELRLREVVKAERAEQLQSDAEHHTRQVIQKRAETFLKRVDEVRDRLPDFDQVVTDATPISDFAADIIAESEVGPQIAYHLGKNQDLAREIRNMPPHLQGRALARIEAQVSVPIRKLTSAPPPTPRVGGGSSPAAKDPSQMGMAEYSEWYRKRSRAN